VKDTLIETDCIVVGSGVAGLYAAWCAASNGRVVLVTGEALRSGSSYWAQGGIAAVTTADDALALHVEDTLAAGRGLCDEAAVELLVREGAADVAKLIEAGMPFDREADGQPSRGLEGGHSRRRILHAMGVQTGRALVEFLARQVEQTANIQVIEYAAVCELLMADDACAGVQINRHADGASQCIAAPATILATGGYASLYRRTTNPHTSIGDGLLLAAAAGARLRDLEFVQFHPTAFYASDGATFLISEALRGAGAHLRNAAGERFLADKPQAELAPRDVVAREIFAQIEAGPLPHVYLDIRHLDIDELGGHFQHLLDRIADQGVDARKTGIPVAPAAHYCVGGVATDLNAATDVPGLYAAGEVAATGVHGANRLASNSLLECLVFARRAAAHAAQTRTEPVDPPRPVALAQDASAASDFAYFKSNVADLLNAHVGILRDAASLQSAVEALSRLSAGETASSSALPDEYFRRRRRGLLELALAITESALARTESRGVHQRRDYPELSEPAVHSDSVARFTRFPVRTRT
jgi:L-aspartate oxidase